MPLGDKPGEGREKRRKCYSEIGVPVKLASRCAFSEKNYKVDLSIALRPSIMFPVKGVLHTWAEPNIISERLLPPIWNDYVRRRILPRVTDASKNPMTIGGVVSLHVRVGDPNTKAQFLMSRNSAVGATL